MDVLIFMLVVAIHEIRTYIYKFSLLSYIYHILPVNTYVSTVIIAFNEGRSVASKQGQLLSKGYYNPRMATIHKKKVRP